jgi:hypothetical protein
MKKATKALVLMTAALVVGGCGSTKMYFSDRGRDLMDVCSLTIGTGAGAKARVGPLGGGVILDKSLAGLRGGDTFTAQFGPSHRGPNDIDFAFICMGWERFGSSETSEARHKDFDGKTECHALGGMLTPFFYTLDPEARERANCPSFYSQVDVVAGFGLTVRAGFNPGELLDLLLGIFGFDIYGDDISATKNTEETEPPVVVDPHLGGS